jgi:hypothetical protein
MMIVLVVAMAVCAAAQAPAKDSGADNDAANGATNSGAVKDAAQSDAQGSPQFTQRDGDEVLALIRDGLTGHSQRTFLRAFDASRMDGYLAFKDQVTEFFSRNDAFRVNIKIMNSSADGEKGLVTASFQMEATPRDGNSVRRESQLRFVMERGKNGWRIVDVSPRNFFQ